MLQRDSGIVRELAKRYRELAELPVNRERERRIRQTNGLRPCRPPVWIDELPWNELDIDGQLVLCCEDPLAREVECYLRRKLFAWKYFQADMVLKPLYPVAKAFRDTGFGLAVAEHTVATDRDNPIISHAYQDQLDTDAKLDALTGPVITADPQADRRTLAKAQELLGDALPAELRGHSIYHAPWDVISRYRGVEPILIDLVERPEFLHKTIARFTEFYTARAEQMEALGLLEAHPDDLHCTPPYVDELPGPGHDGGRVKLSGVWFRGMAQIFGAISPDMHEEFDLHYMRPLMARCGLAYYGCCEPLDRFISRLKAVPNMRKIGVSPWADARSCAEQIGGGYVFAKKPNPALVVDPFDAEAVRKEVTETVEACLRHGCPYELVLKDVSTVSHRPQNLIAWNDTVQRVLDGYYA
ncbi:MAG: hypothetical protein FWE77_03015 [Clostridia bacterium]|nr:hypothetical protein [Clostridia bacterium]